MDVINPFEVPNGRPFFYESARRFTLFSYHTSHGPLLLRSGKGPHPTRLDIVIMDVRAMEIRSWFDGIRIEEAGPGYLEKQHSNPTEMVEPGNKIYALLGTGWRGFVVGGSIFLHEDTGELMDPNPLLGVPEAG